MSSTASKYDQGSITVYRVIGKESQVCSLGETHEIELVVRKFLGPVFSKVPHDNGYSVEEVPVRQDAQGRSYEAHYPIDYCGSTTWWLPNVGHFDTRPPYGLHRFISPSDVQVITILKVGT